MARISPVAGWYESLVGGGNATLLRWRLVPAGRIVAYDHGMGVLPKTPDMCAMCGSADGAGYLAVQVAPGSPFVEARFVVSSVCGACKSRQRVQESYRLFDDEPVADQFARIEQLLSHETGLSVYYEGESGEPPAGVREPRRMPPDEGSGKVARGE